MNEEHIKELEGWGFEQDLIEKARKEAIRTEHQLILLDDETLFELYNKIRKEAETRSKNQLKKQRGQLSHK